MLPHGFPFPLGGKALVSDSVDSVFVHGDRNREILFMLAVAQSEVSEIVSTLGVSVIEIARLTELYLAGLADIRQCSECKRRFSSLAYSDLKCPVCVAFSDVDDA